MSDSEGSLYSEHEHDHEQEDEHGGEEEELPIKQIFGDYAFAHSLAFWRGAVWSLFAGCLLGLLALGFINLITYVPELWQGEKYYEHLDQICYKCGKPWWIAVTTGFGLLIGVLRANFLPKTPAGFMQEALEQHVHAKQTPWVVLLSALSLIGGGCVGPEQGLGSLGGAFGTSWAGRGKRIGMKHLSRREARMNTITGMCAALGSLLPSPYLSCVLIFELGGNNIFQHYLESVAHAGLASTASFIVFKSLAGRTFLQTMALPLSGYDLANLERGELPSFEFKLYWQALLLGLVSAVVGIVIMITQGIFMRIAQRMHQRFGTTKAHIVLW